MPSRGHLIRIACMLTWILLVSAGSFPVAAAHPILAEVSALIDEGWYDDAHDLLESSAAGLPKDAEFNALRGKLYFLLGDLKEAEKYSERAVKETPDNAEFQHWYGHIMGRRAQEGSKIKALGRAKKCKRAYERAAELAPANPAMQRSLMEYLLHAPGFVGGDREQARAIAEHLMELNPIDGHLALATIAEADDEDRAAVEGHVRRASAADPTDPTPHFRLAGLLLRQGEEARAESICVALAAVDSLTARARHQLAQAYLTAERFSDARVECETILARDSTDLSALYQIGRIEILAQGDLARAEECFRTYLESRLKGWWPSRAGAHWRLAMVYDMQGDKARALTEVERSLELDPKFGEARKLHEQLDDGLDDF